MSQLGEQDACKPREGPRKQSQPVGVAHRALSEQSCGGMGCTPTLAATEVLEADGSLT